MGNRLFHYVGSKLDLLILNVVSAEAGMAFGMTCVTSHLKGGVP